MVKLEINGKGITAQEGQTVLEVARANGIRIPTLCHDPRLEPFGACRLCLVEIEGAKGYPPACTAKISEGMIVKTDTPTLYEMRRGVLELILSDHPNDCMVCEKTGECELQDLAYEYHIDILNLHYQGKKRSYTVSDPNPLIERNYPYCILCGRCVRIHREVQGCFVFDFVNRGFETAPTTPYDRSLLDSPCVFCGQCTSACPVAALTDKMSLGKGRVFQTKQVTTTCPYCGVGCQLRAYVKDNKIIKIDSPLGAEPNEGNLCVKGRYGYTFVNHPERLKSPLIREKLSQAFKKVSWEEALSLVVSRFKAIKERVGPGAIGALSSSRGTNEENYLAQKFMRAVIGTNNIDNCARVCHAPSVTGLRSALGSGAATNSLKDIEGAEVILVCGSNTTEAHPIAGLKIKKAIRRGAKLILIDPRQIELANLAHIWLRLKPGTNVALINGLLHVIIKEGLEDREFIAERTEGFEFIKQVVAAYTPEKVEEITGVPEKKIVEAARAYAGTRKGIIFYGLGVTEHKAGSYGVMSLANLALITGNIGRPNTGINPLRGQNNVQGSCDMGALPDVFVGYQRVDDPDANQKFSSAWGCPLPVRVGLKEPEMYEAALQGRLKDLYIIGYDPARTHANTNRVKEALKRLDFLVVQELFLTETTNYAHVILPATSFFEKEGTITNAERRIRRVRQVLQPLEGTKHDWEIICLLAQGLGYPMSYSSPSDIMDEIAKLTPEFAGVSYERLGEKGLIWPVWDKNHPGTPILHENVFTRGKGKFNDVSYTLSGEVIEDEYPFLLTTGRILYHFNNSSMTSRSSGFQILAPEEQAEIHPDDAHKLGIKDGDWVKVSSHWGEVTVRTKVTPRSLPGTIFMSFHYQDTHTNVLTGQCLDTLALTPEYKVTAVKITKLRGSLEKSGV